VDTAAVPLQPVRLDGLTVVDDPAFLATLQKEQNLPAGIASAIAGYFGG
jgi:5-methylthioadenosine/S-adenosylhomocysteine deaminase